MEAFFSTSSEVCVRVFLNIIYVYVVCVTCKRRERLGIGNVTDHLTMANGEYKIKMLLSILSIDLGAAMLAPSCS